jgi:hypothetical protein
MKAAKHAITARRAPMEYSGATKTGCGEPTTMGVPVKADAGMLPDIVSGAVKTVGVT